MKLKLAESFNTCPKCRWIGLGFILIDTVGLSILAVIGSAIFLSLNKAYYILYFVTLPLFILSTIPVSMQFFRNHTKTGTCIRNPVHNYE